jgi:acyl carrier protein
LGEEVAAAVVLVDGYAVSERQLREFAATRLAPFKVPRQIHFVPEIPKGPTGKIQRIGLAERLGVAAPGQPRNHEKPSTLRADRAKACVSTTAAIASIWREVLNTEKVDPEADFLDLGGDSMLATMLCARVFERFGVELPLIDFFEASSINSQAVLIKRLLAR